MHTPCIFTGPTDALSFDSGPAPAEGWPSG